MLQLAIKPLLIVVIMLGILAIESAAQTANQQAILATKTFKLREASEVGLELKARAVGASWARAGAEAAALLVEVDGAYNQDVLLWMGDEAFTYRITLGRLPPGAHTVAVKLNPTRSAPAIKRAEVSSLTTIFLAASTPLADNSNKLNDAAADIEARLALAYSPVLYARANTIDRFTDVPLLMYYELERPAPNSLILRYTVVFSHEDGGTPTAALMARWGRATDIEWVYQVRFDASRRVVEEIYQGIEHKTQIFTGARFNGTHPLLAVASTNNNFSDSGTSEMRFALFPVQVDLTTSSREAVMDREAWTYRVMTEELTRENLISQTPAGAKLIADPRDYLYIEAYGEQTGATLAFDVRLNSDLQAYASDALDPRLRIERSGYFRSAIRLPHGTRAAQQLATITARCHASTQPTSQLPTPQQTSHRACRNVRLSKVFTLDRNFTPRSLPLPKQSPITLAPNATTEIKVGRRRAKVWTKPLGFDLTDFI